MILSAALDRGYIFMAFLAIIARGNAYHIDLIEGKNNKKSGFTLHP